MAILDLPHRLRLAVKQLRVRVGRKQPGLQPRVLYKDRDLLISALPGTGRTAVLVFTGMRGAMGGHQAIEFPRLASARGEPVIFVSDLRISWYTAPGQVERIRREVEAYCAAQGIQELRTLGNSMGGYGAILFSTVLPVCTVAAFVPQIRMTPDVLAMPHWQRSVSRIGPSVVRDLNDRMAASRAQFTLIFGDQDIDDRLHTAALRPAPNVDVLVLPGVDHDAARWLKTRGMLEPLGAAMLEGRRDEVARLSASLTNLSKPLAA